MKSSLASALHRSIPLLAMAMLSLAGCGGDGVDRHPVSGTVTYDGKPVPTGSITFIPDASVGKIAPTTYAKIENGVFKTDPAKSPTKGKYKVQVNAYDLANKKGAGEDVEIPALFPQYSMDVEIPPPSGELKIEVPAAAKN